MEEEIKEVAKEECCTKKGMFMKHHHHCCGHKLVKAIILVVVIFAIFSVGVAVGSHLGRGRSFEKGNFNQRGGQMMRGYNNNMMPGQNGGRRFHNQINQGQFQGQIEVQAQPSVQTIPAATIQVVAPNQVKTVTPAK